MSDQSKLIQISTRIQPEEYEFLVQIATAERRSMSNTIEMIVLEYINNRLSNQNTKD